MWPFIELWGEESEAVRGYLRETWESTTRPRGSLELTDNNARIEMNSILGVTLYTLHAK